MWKTVVKASDFCNPDYVLFSKPYRDSFVAREKRLAKGTWEHQFQPIENFLPLVRRLPSLMAVSAYAVDPDFGASKWSTTRRKLAPAIKAVITGFTS